MGCVQADEAGGFRERWGSSHVGVAGEGGWLGVGVCGCVWVCVGGG